MVVNASDQPLADLPIDVIANTSPIAFHGGEQWQVTTDSAGHFALPLAASVVQPYWTWSASAVFPWFGGTVPMDLGTASASDPTHLEFRSNPGGLNAWQIVTKCVDLTSGQAASSVSVTFTPVQLVDGSAGAGATLTKSTTDACEVGSYDIPAGAWLLANATDNLGRPVLLSTDGINFSSSVEVGNNTGQGGTVWLGFAPQTQ